ncbi:MAG: FimV/HubP family polar landmark protein [Gammaproteobacteria bacterium]|nr:FimV/HubP family polar landmark protein [Gammaproteobacteria bacterium]
MWKYMVLRSRTLRREEQTDMRQYFLFVARAVSFNLILSIFYGHVFALSETLNLPSLEVERGDTLYSLSKDLFPGERVSPQQVMLAFQRLNPEAFKKRNINGLYAGVTLVRPIMTEAQRLSQQEAMAEVRRQNELYSIIIPEDSEGVFQLINRSAALDVRIAELEQQIRVQDAENVALSNRLTSLSARLIETDEVVSSLKLQIASLDLQLETAQEIKMVDESPDLGAISDVEEIVSLQSQRVQLQPGLLFGAFVGVVVVSVLGLFWIRRRRENYDPKSVDQGETSSLAKELNKDANFSGSTQPGSRIKSNEISGLHKEAVSEVQLKSPETLDDQEPGLSADDTASEVEIATKLELAYAYSKMGDMESVRKLLGEVVGSANETQRVEAENLMKGLLDSDNARDTDE